MLNIIKKILEGGLAVVKGVIEMTEVVRVTPGETHGKLESSKAMLVCAYKDDAKFRKVQLEGALSFSEFEPKVGSLPKNQEIIFYCA